MFVNGMIFLEWGEITTYFVLVWAVAVGINNCTAITWSLSLSSRVVCFPSFFFLDGRSSDRRSKLKCSWMVGFSWMVRRSWTMTMTTTHHEHVSFIGMQVDRHKKWVKVLSIFPQVPNYLSKLHPVASTSSSSFRRPSTFVAQRKDGVNELHMTSQWKLYLVNILFPLYLVNLKLKFWN